MDKLAKLLLIPLVFLGTLPVHAGGSRHFWEIPDPALPYIAKIRVSPRSGTTVVYNSKICKEIGAACGFFRTHAHAHDMLSHNIMPPDAYSKSLEDQADCWAARNAAPEEVSAAVALLSDPDRLAGLPVTGNPAERAEKIRACAVEGGNWIAGK